jgi:hypothetical protein
VSDAVSTAPTRMLPGQTVLRVVWLPGSDTLRGYCWCGAEQDAEDPVQLWEWLLGHPDHYHRDRGAGADAQHA